MPKNEISTRYFRNLVELQDLDLDLGLVLLFLKVFLEVLA